MAKRGRPKGSKNKVKKVGRPRKVQKKKRGRPKGSKNKPKVVAVEPEAPKTRVTQFQTDIQNAREAMKTKANKRKTAPGPWTDLDPSFQVKARLRSTTGIIGEAFGAYPRKEHAPHTPKGWYAILFNITSKSIKRDVEEHGIDMYLAACERSLNSPDNKKRYGTIVLLQAAGDHSLREERDRRFVSCYAKTNKKSIKGFLAVRQKKYGVIQ